jgi:NitT/TauT family transport system permease protein
MRAAERRGQGFYPALSLACALALWWTLALLLASPTLPTPARVFATVWDATLHGTLLHDIAASLARVAAAFVLAMAAGTGIGWIMGRSPRLDALLDPLLVVALNVPVLVVVVLAYVWLGLNDAAAVLAVVVVKTPTVAITVREGVRAIDSGLDELAQVFHLPLARRLRHVILPQLAPYLAAAGRSGLAITWKIVLIVELLGRPDGIGFAINMRFQDFDVAGIVGYGLVFAIVMLVVEAAVLRPWERRANAWRG